MKNQIKEFLDQLPPEYDEYIESIAKLHRDLDQTKKQRDELLEAAKDLLSEIDTPDYPTHTGMALIYKDKIKAAIAAAEEGNKTKPN